MSITNLSSFVSLIKHKEMNPNCFIFTILFKNNSAYVKGVPGSATFQRYVTIDFYPFLSLEKTANRTVMPNNAKRKNIFFRETIDIMRTELTALIVTLVGTNAFVMPSSKKLSTKLNAGVNSMWAHDPYGRNEQQGGRLPTELEIHEDDPWYYHPWSGVSQYDFYPRVCKQEFCF